MKISKTLKDIMLSITTEDVEEVWGESTYEDDLDKWCNDKTKEVSSWIKGGMPWRAIDATIELWEKYLANSDLCTANDGLGGLSVLRRATWQWSTMGLKKIPSYHYDIPYCIAYIENGSIAFHDTQPTREQVSKVVMALKAIRHGRPSPFSENEKKQIKDTYRRHCCEQGFEAAYKKYFAEGGEETQRKGFQ
jgi:hypothetical protein